MYPKVTKQVLQAMVNRLNEETGESYVLDYDKYQRKYRVFLHERGLNTHGLVGSTTMWWNNHELRAYLEGIFAGIKQGMYGERR